MRSLVPSTENQIQGFDVHKPLNPEMDEATTVDNPKLMPHDLLLGPHGTLSSFTIDEKQPKLTKSKSYRPTKKSASDLVLETYNRSLSGRMAHFASLETFMFPSAEMPIFDPKSSYSGQNERSDDVPVVDRPTLKTNEDSDHVPNVDHPTFEPKEKPKEVPIVDRPTFESNEQCNQVPIVDRPTFQHGRTYNVIKKNVGFSKIPLPQSAASFYGRNSGEFEVMGTCQGVDRLNRYLKERKSDIRAGVPGRFLHAVIGQETTDVGSIASTIMYAFYLHETLKSKELCTIPIINTKRSDVNIHPELKWLFDSCHIDRSSLVFIDEIDLAYYDLFGSLKIVLLNGHKLPAKQEALKEALVEIFNCKEANALYPWVDTVTLAEGCSCCALIANKFALTSPEILAGQGFSRLLLAGVLLDTGNLASVECTSKDKYMATLLIIGAGQFGCNGLYQILKYKKFDISELKVREILRKDFKKWTRVSGKPDNSSSRLSISHVGMSSIGISVGQLLTHGPSAAEEVIQFQKSEKLRLLMVVSGYYDSQKNFKREILISANTVEHMRNLLHFFNSNSSQLPLKVINQPGLREELRAFEIDNKITSRKTIERLLEEFGGARRE